MLKHIPSEIVVHILKVGAESFQPNEYYTTRTNGFLYNPSLVSHQWKLCGSPQLYSNITISGVQSVRDFIQGQKGGCKFTTNSLILRGNIRADYVRQVLHLVHGLRVLEFGFNSGWPLDPSLLEDSSLAGEFVLLGRCPGGVCQHFN